MLKGKTRAFAKGDLVEEFGDVDADCPCKTMRAVECVDGALELVVAKAADAQHSDLVDKCQVYCTPEQWQTVMVDFEIARGQLMLEISTKTNFWKLLPWILIGLAHWDEAKAQQFAERAVELWDAIDPEAQHLSHRVTIKFMHPGGHLRSQMNLFIAGAPRSTLSVMFRKAVAKIANIPICSRIIEAKHKDVKKRKGHHKAGPIPCSLAIRRPIIEMELRRKPTALNELAESFNDSRQIKKLISIFGFGSHPNLLALKASQDYVHPTKWVKECIPIVYRCDAASQFRDLSAVKAAHEKQVSKEKREEAKHTVPKERLDFDQVMCQSLVSHLREVCPSSGRMICSLPVVNGSVAGVPSIAQLSDVLQDPLFRRKAARKRRVGEMLALTNGDDDDLGISANGMKSEYRDWGVTDGGPRLEPDVSADTADTVNTRWVFKILDLNPSKLKTVRISGVSGGKMTSQTIAITHHEMITDTEGTCLVKQEPSKPPGAASPVLLITDFKGADLEMLREEFHFWDTSDKPTFALKGFESGSSSPELTSQIIGALLQVGAYPTVGGNGGNNLDLGKDDPKNQALHDMELFNLVTSTPKAGGTHMAWCLTEKGKASISFHQAINNPMRLCDLPTDPNVPLEDFTGYQLALLAKDRDWVWSCKATKAQKKMTPYQLGGPQRWYTSGVTVNEPYLRALLSATSLRDDFGIESIPHGLPITNYEKILEGVDPTTIVAVSGAHALEMDVADESDALQLVSTNRKRGRRGGRHACTMLELERELERIIDDNEWELPEEPLAPIPIQDNRQPVATPAPTGAANNARALEEPARYGVFRITARQPGERGGGRFGCYIAVCPFHAKSRVPKTGCQKQISLEGTGAADQERALRQIKFWCTVAKQYQKQWEHVFVADVTTAPSLDELDALVITQGPIEPVIADDEQYNEAPEERSLSAAPARGRGRRGRGRGRGHASQPTVKGASSVAPAPSGSNTPPAPPSPPSSLKSSEHLDFSDFSD